MIIVLASASPRRKELLAGLGVLFEVFPSEASEEGSSEVPSHAAAAHALSLARRKGEVVVARLRAAGAAAAENAAAKSIGVAGKPARPERLVVSADTIVVLPDRILGKPSSVEEAGEMLRALSGREHTVVTAVVVTDPVSGETHGATEATRVFFRDLSPGDIAAYVATGEPADKAGAYAVQGVGSLLVERIVGDYFNVVGLPLGCLAKLVGRFGVDLLMEAAHRAAGRAPAEN